MRKLLTIFVLCVLTSFTNCNCKKRPWKLTHRRHFNILIAPDLSNRLYINPPIKSDCFVIQQFVKLLYPDIINNDSRDHQCDIFKLAFINERHIKDYGIEPVTIDLKQYKYHQQDRNNYLGIFEGTSGFKRDTARFVKSIRDLEDTVIRSSRCGHNYGSDIYNFIERLDFVKIDTAVDISTDKLNHETVLYNYDNIIILLTDGYIEVGNKDNPKSLSENQVKKFRRDYLKKGKNKELQDFLDENREEYAVLPIKNKALKYTKILVLQVSDRGGSSGGNKNDQLSDFKIMKLLWTDWLIQSGVGSNNILFLSNNETSSEADTKNIFKYFLKLDTK